MLIFVFFKISIRNKEILLFGMGPRNWIRMKEMSRFVSLKFTLAVSLLVFVLFLAFPSFGFSSFHHPSLFKGWVLFQYFSEAELCHCRAKFKHSTYCLNQSCYNNEHWSGGGWKYSLHFTMVSSAFRPYWPTCRKDGTLGIMSVYIRQLVQLFRGGTFGKVVLPFGMLTR